VRTQPQPAEVKGLAAVGVDAGHVARRLVGGNALVGGDDVVVVAARVVVRDEEESAVPLWRRAQRLVDVLEEPLALGDVVARVVARLDGRVKPRDGGQ